ncbi:MAG: D-hexose-6-phosphate mutarotase [Phycisphaerales bacterium]|nr:D-hexose-6-phosphate mutarotase [Phycisphaerales bacterium]
MDLASPQQRFAIPGAVEFDAGEGGLPRVTITTPAATAEVYLHGAHVTRYAPAGGRPVLFVSRQSHYADGKPIRGGVPVIFPWFGPNTADSRLPAHGFVRTRRWDVAAVERLVDGSVLLRLTTSSDGRSREQWPREFALAVTVTVGRSLTVALEVRNTDEKPFRFEAALHTYLAVYDVRAVAIDGLAGREYLDKTANGTRRTQPDGPFGVTAETDRLYLNTTEAVTVTDPGGPAEGGGGEAGPRTVVVSKSGSASTVVWNPWVAKAAALADFGDDEWPQMLCVETANAGENALMLEPGQTHVMATEVVVQ